MTQHSNSLPFSRRGLLQSVGSAGLVGLAGCMGGDSDQDSESTETVDQTPEPTEDPGPDYSVPESEHMDLGQMARDWGAVFPNGNVTSGFSPSQMYEAVDDPDVLRNTAPGLYEGVLDFDHRHVPETFIQRAWSNGAEYVKVDQLPGDTTRGGLEESLEDEGFEKVEKKKNLLSIKMYRDQKPELSVITTMLRLLILANLTVNLQLINTLINLTQYLIITSHQRCRLMIMPRMY